MAAKSVKKYPGERRPVDNFTDRRKRIPNIRRSAGLWVGEKRVGGFRAGNTSTEPSLMGSGGLITG